MENKKFPGTMFHHCSINVNDYDKSVAFYKALGMDVYLEWETEPTEQESGRHCFIDTGNGPFLELHSSNKRNLQANRFQHFCFQVEDVDAFYAAAIQNGATSIAKPRDCPLPCRPNPILKARVAHVYGPDGEPFELINWYGYQPDKPADK